MKDIAIWMKCPYCNLTFPLTQKQVDYNTKFKCPHCRQYNCGSTRQEGEVLIGERINLYR